MSKIGIFAVSLALIIASCFLLKRMGCDANCLQKEQELMHRCVGDGTLPRRCKVSLGDHTAVERSISFLSRKSKGSSDFIERKGILVHRPHSPAVILMCHGFMCDKHDTRFLRILFDEYTTVSFDFRAHGENTKGQLCSFGSDEMLDVIGAVKFIKSQPELRNKPLIVYGFSMGAVSSILAQAEKGNLFDAAIWDCPFESTDKIIERCIEKLNINLAGYNLGFPGKELLKNNAYNPRVQNLIKAAMKTVNKIDTVDVETCMKPVDTIAALKKIKIPMLIISCKNDKKVPVSAIKQLYNASGSRFKRCVITDGRFHFDSFFHNPERYSYEVRMFIKKVLDGSAYRDFTHEIVEDKISPTAQKRGRIIQEVEFDKAV